MTENNQLLAAVNTADVRRIKIRYFYPIDLDLRPMQGLKIDFALRLHVFSDNVIGVGHVDRKSIRRPGQGSQ